MTGSSHGLCNLTSYVQFHTKVNKIHEKWGGKKKKKKKTVNASVSHYTVTPWDGMKVQIATPFHVSHMQQYGVMLHSNITSVYPPLQSRTLYLLWINSWSSQVSKSGHNIMLLSNITSTIAVILINLIFYWPCIIMYHSNVTQLNTFSLSQTLCVLILYMFRASSVHLQEALH
jgi:hypothetical protein